MLKAIELVNFVKGKIGTNYVYGMKGIKMTASKYNWLKKTYPAYVPASDEKKIGTVCVDCSGLIAWATGTQRNSAAYKSTAKKVLPIKDIAMAVPGCAVWRSGHIGVYIGDGYVIEARGSRYGTVKTKVKDRDFTHILWLCDIDYTEEKKETKQEKTVKIELDVLKKGTKGEQVKTLQRLLTALGYNIGSSGVDGSFGPSTDTAVRKYQKDNKLDSNGSVDEKTWNSLLK